MQRDHVAAGVLLLLCGCSTAPQVAAPELFCRIEVGMSRGEVESLLGPPIATRSAAAPPVPRCGETWYLPFGETDALDSSGAPGAIGVTFGPNGTVMCTRLSPRDPEASRACAVGDVCGHYLCMGGPDIWDELDLRADGRCEWTSATCARLPVQRIVTAGSWSLDRDRVILTLDRAPNVIHPLSDTQPAVRRWWGHVYLVPRRDVAWFDANGPMDEFCFARRAAPLIVFPDVARE